MSARLAFPYRIDATGHTATCDVPAYVEALVRLVLQTSPGERVNRPAFGGGLKALVFLSMDDAFASAAETLIRGVLLHWLGDTIAIRTLQVTTQGSEALVSLTYLVSGSAPPIAQVVRQGMPGFEAMPIDTGARAPVSNAISDLAAPGRPRVRLVP